MSKTYPLSKLQEGEIAEVDCILPSSNIRRRLQDIGLINGTKVECLHQSPSGDPVAYYIRGATIAIRREDSESILVCPC
ncbi:MAG: FeoA family protein [Oscillospiraceae bacterium]